MTTTFDQLGITFDDLTLTIDGETINPVDISQIAGDYLTTVLVTGSLDQVAVGGSYSTTITPISGDYATSVTAAGTYSSSIAIAGSYDTVITGGGTP